MENFGDVFKLGSRTQREHANYKRLFDKHLKIIQTMHRFGVKILAGTDTMLYSIPGFNLHDELELLVRAGLSPLEALQTATLNPAEYLNKMDEFGTVEVGKRADIVLLKENPLLGIGNTRKIGAVV